MKTKTLYTCDICHTDYADKEKAKQCEKSHKVLESACIVGEYKPITMHPNGEPYKIKVKFKGSNNFTEYISIR